ncbi:homeodomain-interacting protein kinase 1-like [Sebastes umbrosus]|uniref:homeodomain-interacting protein kinase 1-like n=1 Tax=Sebastes umbrosus TaxID=72105 RepID=UPI00189F4D50|nr:homeodomain-interacting protein kinase 1-like [Sebastes umbrosus]
MASDDLPIFEGSLLGQSHKVEALLGKGGFGFVTKCRNLETGKAVAVKVIKDLPGEAEQTKMEIDILKRLRCLDPDACNIVRCNGFFLDNDLTCLVFELLDQSLFDYMEERRNRGLPVTELRPVVHQLATALTHLSSIGIVHADIKPENIMVVDRRQQPLKVKLIDFGLAFPASTAKPGVCLQTTWYRAPEVMMHIPFNDAIDMWSLGLVAAELATGYPLYPGEMNYDVLSFIIETQGQPADYVLDRGVCTEYYFQYESNSEQHWRFKTPEEYDPGLYSEDTRYTKLTCLDDLEQLMSGGQQSDQRLLVDLIKRMLQLDADQRIKPPEVLQHTFFAPSLPQSSPANICIEMMDTEESTPEVSQQPPCCLITGPEILQCRVERTTAYKAVEAEENTEEVDVRPENDGCLCRFFRAITHACYFNCTYFFTAVTHACDFYCNCTLSATSSV